MEKEIWKELCFIDRAGEKTTMCDYMVSNFGNIKKISSEKMIKQTRTKLNYRSIQLTTCEGKKSFLVHRLVAFAFLPNPENKPQINHKNKIRYDNHVDNLEWCTQAENNKHSAFTKRGFITK